MAVAGQLASYERPRAASGGMSGGRVRRVVLAAIRVAVGIFFVAAGMQKLLDHDDYVVRFDRWGLPAPSTAAYVAAGIEIVAGLILLLGLAHALRGAGAAARDAGRWPRPPAASTAAPSSSSRRRAGLLLPDPRRPRRRRRGSCSTCSTRRAGRDRSGPRARDPAARPRLRRHRLPRLGRAAGAADGAGGAAGGARPRVPGLVGAPRRGAHRRRRARRRPRSRAARSAPGRRSPRRRGR